VGSAFGPAGGQGKHDLIAKAVECAKEFGVPSGVGAHSLDVIKLCEAQGVNADFYIKTFHHHSYPTAPKPDEIKGPYSEFPGYWCSNPQETTDVMAKVKKPWIAFKTMAAGAIPPQNAFRFAFMNGADYVLAGMFDFEIAEDARLACEAVGAAQGAAPPLGRSRAGPCINCFMKSNHYLHFPRAAFISCLAQAVRRPISRSPRFSLSASIGTTAKSAALRSRQHAQGTRLSGCGPHLAR
jgi:hypothetical protein